MSEYQEWKQRVLSSTDYGNMDKYEYRALCFAEHNGILEYKVVKNQMIFYSSFPLEHSTIKAVVDLDTLKETRDYLKRYYKAYDKKIGGIQVNYCA